MTGCLSLLPLKGKETALDNFEFWVLSERVIESISLGRLKANWSPVDVQAAVLLKSHIRSLAFLPFKDFDCFQ